MLGAWWCGCREAIRSLPPPPPTSLWPQHCQQAKAMLKLAQDAITKSATTISFSVDELGTFAAKADNAHEIFMTVADAAARAKP